MNYDNCEHLSDGQLHELLFASEEQIDTTEVALHVENCQTCQMRLTELADEGSIELEACQMLSSYREDSRIALCSSSLDRENDCEIDCSFERVLLEPPSHPEMLGRLGRYEIERKIGSGGMGIVFKAIDTELNRPVAVKVLAPYLSRNGAARQRFSRESRAAAAVVHEHVVAIHNVDSNVEHPYLVMQYVAGESLQSRVDREGPLSAQQILRIGVQAALGLAAAHKQGIVHRDIKPANILLEDGVERLLITDFGLARTVDDASLTHTGVVAGTPNYMSPEQAKGEAVDHRTDLFSLGAVLYFVATGHPPFRAEKAMGVLHRICHERHRPVWQVNPAVPDDLSMAIDRLLEKRPSRRFNNATAVAETLSQILQRTQNRRPSRSSGLRSWMRRHRAAVTLCTFALLAISGWMIWAKLTDTPLVSELANNPSEVKAKNFSSSTNAEQPLVDSQSTQSAGLKSAAVPNYNSTANHIAEVITSDRVEFEQDIDWANHTLSQIDPTTSTVERDATSDFRSELNLLEKTLKTIDPSGK